MTDEPKKGGGRPPRRLKTVAIQIRVTEAMARELEALAEERQHSRTQEIVLLIEKELKATNRWPPKPVTPTEGDQP